MLGNTEVFPALLPRLDKFQLRENSLTKTDEISDDFACGGRRLAFRKSRTTSVKALKDRRFGGFGLSCLPYLTIKIFKFQVRKPLRFS
jgi:hypothetical protein